MNINSLRKNYDKLTTKERFAAMVAADMRGDKEEQEALIQSAPRIAFRVRHTYGLSQAFNSLSMFHQVRQLNDAGLILISWQIMDNNIPSKDPELIFNHACGLALRFRTHAAAWAALCNEYNIAPDSMLKCLPGMEVIEAANELALLLSDDNMPDFQAVLDDLRAALEYVSRQWQ